MDNTSFDIINGIRWKDKNSEKFSDVFEIDLSFTQLCNHLKSHKQNIFSRDMPLVCAKFPCESIMYVDYSNSYKNTQQYEIQSAYSEHTCFSIFIACCYYQSGLSDGLENAAVTITSESSDHLVLLHF